MIVEQKSFIAAGEALAALTPDLPPQAAIVLGRVARVFKDTPGDLDCSRPSQTHDLLSSAVNMCYGVCLDLANPAITEIELAGARISPSLFRVGSAPEKLELATEHLRLLRLELDFPELAE